MTTLQRKIHRGKWCKEKYVETLAVVEFGKGVLWMFSFLTSIFQIFVLWLHCFSLKKERIKQESTTVVHPVNEPNPSSTVLFTGPRAGYLWPPRPPGPTLLLHCPLCKYQGGPWAWREERKEHPWGGGVHSPHNSEDKRWERNCQAMTLEMGVNPLMASVTPCGCHCAWHVWLGTHGGTAVTSCSRAMKDILLRDVMSTSICTPTVSFTLCNQPLYLPD